MRKIHIPTLSAEARPTSRSTGQTRAASDREPAAEGEWLLVTVLKGGTPLSSSASTQVPAIATEVSKSRRRPSTVLASPAIALSLPTRAPAGVQGWPAWVTALVGRPLFWLAVVAVGVAVPVLGQVLRRPPPPLPHLGTLPDFRLIDQEGHPFGGAELRGKVWVAGFIFTRCPTI